MIQVVLDNVTNRLRIRSTSRSQTKDVITEKRDLVCTAARSITAHGRSSIGTQHYTTIEGNGQNGGSGAFLTLLQSVRIVAVRSQGSGAAFKGSHHTEEVYIVLS